MYYTLTTKERADKLLSVHYPVNQGDKLVEGVTFIYFRMLTLKAAKTKLLFCAKYKLFTALNNTKRTRTRKGLDSPPIPSNVLHTCLCITTAVFT